MKRILAIACSIFLLLPMHADNVSAKFAERIQTLKVRLYEKFKNSTKGIDDQDKKTVAAAAFGALALLSTGLGIVGWQVAKHSRKQQEAKKDSDDEHTSVSNMVEKYALNAGTGVDAEHSSDEVSGTINNGIMQSEESVPSGPSGSDTEYDIGADSDFVVEEADLTQLSAHASLEKTSTIAASPSISDSEFPLDSDRDKATGMDAIVVQDVPIQEVSDSEHGAKEEEFDGQGSMVFKTASEENLLAQQARQLDGFDKQDKRDWFKPVKTKRKPDDNCELKNKEETASLLEHLKSSTTINPKILQRNITVAGTKNTLTHNITINFVLRDIPSQQEDLLYKQFDAWRKTRNLNDSISVRRFRLVNLKKAQRHQDEWPLSYWMTGTFPSRRRSDAEVKAP